MNTDNFYADLYRDFKALMSGETDFLVMMANTSALLNDRLNDINWIGFYLVKGDRLTLGPFQGKIACTQIPWGVGVCGSAIAQNKIQRIDDVHTFDGHIACDTASNSELVLPIIVKNQKVGVLDIDSPSFSRFKEEDEQGMSLLVKAFSALAEETDYIKYFSTHVS
ncbi:GAF domain-containing protein [Pseudocitrobacter sp. 73]|uniref:GAF domain-containing protein n=1 Tax=Pseudocitrobacter sp. 73 TaxID=2605731 RepID=UPI0011EFB6AF|nr:GAF domain-containing protein [Pseudocitrobacter sp. 73]KAA1048575.1 GAF domain-containing protein [Pseudocitrobacter sp. 73]